MALVIRLARHGRKKVPFYSIVVAESSCRRDGRFVCKVGNYNPLKKEGIKIHISDLEMLKKYISHGAKPTDRVKKLIDSAGVL